MKQNNTEPQLPKHIVSGSNERRLDHSFKKEVFDRKVQIHIKCGYTKEMAEKKVLWDYNGLFNEVMGGKPRKRKTGADGYYR